MNVSSPQPRQKFGKPKQRRPIHIPSRKPVVPTSRPRVDAEFLPAALEILEAPPSPVGLALIWTICLLVAVALAWGYFGRVDVIATAQGKIEPIGRVKIIQPVEAGRVTEVKVENGQKVAQGDVLAVLDSGEADADVTDLSAQYEAYHAEALRRIAEQAEAVLVTADAPVPSLPVAQVPLDPSMPASVQTRQRAIMEADIDQLRAEVASLVAQKAQKQRERDRYLSAATALKILIETLQERVDMRASLSSSGSGSKIDLIAAKEALETQQAALATTQAQIGEAQAAMDVLDRSVEASRRTFSAQNLQKLADAERQAEDFQSRLVKARVKQHQLVLRSPIDGTVSGLDITTVGQVVSSGEEVMRIVPDRMGLQITAYLPNRDVGFVHTGQDAVVKIDSLPFTRYGTIDATLTRVADDAIPEPEATQTEGNPAKSQTDRGFAGAVRTQNLVFALTLVPRATSLEADGSMVPLSPGMTLTVEIKTGSRRILEYLISPLVEVASGAMKER